MGTDTGRRFLPDYAVPPGNTLLETIDALGISQSELADRMGRPKKTINEIIKAKAAITAETAIQLERVLGVPADFWIKLEANYRAALARIEERAALTQQQSWLQQIPLRELMRRGWLAAKTDPVEQVREALNYFGVASAEIWRRHWEGLQLNTAYRHSPTFDSSFGALSAWLRRGELEARTVKTAPYDVERFRRVLTESRQWVAKPPNVFQQRLLEEFAKVGVVVLFVPELSGMRVSGATRWLSPDKALIQLTLRHRSEDHIWFTLFHEAAHVLLHQKRAVFIDEESQKADKVAPQADTSEENEANRFARDLLIPPASYTQFCLLRDLSAPAILAFAKQVEIPPGIVVARLQHDGKLPWQSSLNRLKQRYTWKKAH